MIRKIGPILLLVAVCPVLSGCIAYSCSLNPPLTHERSTDEPLEISTFSVAIDNRRGPASNAELYTGILRTAVKPHGDPVEVELSDSDKKSHLHVHVSAPYQDTSGLGYIGYLTLFLIPISHTYEHAQTFTYTYFRDGVAVRKAQFKVRERATAWIFYTAEMMSSDAMGRGQQILLFRDCTEAFLNGSGGEGAQLDGVAVLEPMRGAEPAASPPAATGKEVA